MKVLANAEAVDGSVAAAAFQSKAITSQSRTRSLHARW
jgi:hypothetical protein